MPAKERFGARLKARGNYYLDRVIDWCDKRLFYISRFDSPVRLALEWIIRGIGDFAWLLRDLPRLNIYRLRGAGFSIVFLGSQQSSLEFAHDFYNSEPFTIEEGERIPLLQCSSHARRWLQNGDDLVIVETSRWRPFRPGTSLSIKVNSWVAQIIEIPDDLEQLLSGRRMRGPRRRIRQAEKDGFSFYFTKDVNDLAKFTSEMYIPFVTARYGSRALTSTMQDQFKWWFVPGGLIMATKNGQPIGGTLVIQTGKVCHGIEQGVLHNDPALIQQGINAYLVWATLQWAKQRSARWVSFGGSHGWVSNGPFNFKAQWNPKVIRRKAIYPVWTLMGEQISPALRDKLNAFGPIHEHDGGFYQVFLSDGSGVVAPGLAELASEACKKGLSGIVLVTPGEPYRYVKGVLMPDDLGSTPSNES